MISAGKLCYVLTGHEDKSIRVWATDSGREVTSWQRGHATPPTCLKWAPRRLLCASACNLLNLWIPSLPEMRTMGLVS